MTVKSIFSGLLICLCLLTACDISGTVTDTASGKGIEGVTVRLISTDGSTNASSGARLYSTTTDQDGKYQMKSFLTRPSNGQTLIIHFSKPGYAFEPETAKAVMDEQSLSTINSEGMETR